MNWVKKYSWTITLIILIPITINFVLLIPAFVPIVGDSTEWLSFWGAYISATVAFVILYIQRKDNKDENEKNRKLQLNILTHQQEMQWLNMFRQASVEYVSAYTYNDLVHAINVMKENPKEAFNILGHLLERLAKCDAGLMYIGMRGKDAINLYNKCYSLFILYNDVVNDIQHIMVYILNTKNFTFEGFCVESANMQITDLMKDIISIVATQNNIDMAQRFNDVAMQRVKIIEERASEIRDIFGSYITEEQKRIDSILTIF